MSHLGLTSWVSVHQSVCYRVIEKKEINVKVGAEELKVISQNKKEEEKKKAENWERAEHLREKIDFEKWERESDGSELHQ